MKIIIPTIGTRGDKPPLLMNSSPAPKNFCPACAPTSKCKRPPRRCDLRAEYIFYNPALFRETAAGIHNARLVLYEKMRHPAIGKQFERDVLAFLGETQ